MSSGELRSLMTRIGNERQSLLLRMYSQSSKPDSRGSVKIEANEARNARREQPTADGNRPRSRREPFAREVTANRLALGWMIFDEEDRPTGSKTHYPRNVR